MTSGLVGEMQLQSLLSISPLVTMATTLLAMLVGQISSITCSYCIPAITCTLSLSLSSFPPSPLWPDYGFGHRSLWTSSRPSFSVLMLRFSLAGTSTRRQP
jgi:hypothetical protein